MWERFQTMYHWDPILEHKVKGNWKIMMERRYRDLMRGARLHAAKEATKRGVCADDMNVLKPFHPEWIDLESWTAMIDEHWNKDKWKHISAENKKNRATLIDGQMAGHSGGSRSMIHTQLHMEKVKRGPVQFIEVYENYFTKKRSKSVESSTSREYITMKAGNVAGEYKRLLIENFGPNPSDHPSQIVTELWEKACGGRKKGKMFGATEDILVMATSGASTSCSSCASQKVGHTTDEVRVLKEQLEEQKKETTALKEKDVERDEKLKTLEGQLERVNNFCKQQFPSF